MVRPSDDGGGTDVIVDHNVEAGNPPDAPQLVPAIARVKQRSGKAPQL